MTTAAMYLVFLGLSLSLFTRFYLALLIDKEKTQSVPKEVKVEPKLLVEIVEHQEEEDDVLHTPYTPTVAPATPLPISFVTPSIRASALVQESLAETTPNVHIRPSVVASSVKTTSTSVAVMNSIIPTQPSPPKQDFVEDLSNFTSPSIEKIEVMETVKTEESSGILKSEASSITLNPLTDRESPSPVDKQDIPEPPSIMETKEKPNETLPISNEATNSSVEIPSPTEPTPPKSDQLKEFQEQKIPVIDQQKGEMGRSGTDGQLIDHKERIPVHELDSPGGEKLQGGKEPIGSEMLSFAEWKKKLDTEIEDDNTVDNGKIKVGFSKKKKKPAKKKNVIKKNYASLDCGAKVIASNEEASNEIALLKEDKDTYMLNPCNVRAWFIVELCERIEVDSIDFANFEMFSSTPETFNVYISSRYPTREWENVGSFQGTPVKQLKTYAFNDKFYAKYMKIEIKKYYGKEHYCPISLLRVYGITEVEQFDDDEENEHHEGDHPDGGEHTTESSAHHRREETGEANIFTSAKNAVVGLVNTVTEKLAGGKVENQTAADPNFSEYVVLMPEGHYQAMEIIDSFEFMNSSLFNVTISPNSQIWLHHSFAKKICPSKENIYMQLINENKRRSVRVQESLNTKEMVRSRIKEELNCPKSMITDQSCGNEVTVPPLPKPPLKKDKPSQSAHPSTLLLSSDIKPTEHLIPSASEVQSTESLTPEKINNHTLQVKLKGAVGKTSTLPSLYTFSSEEIPKDLVIESASTKPEDVISPSTSIITVQPSIVQPNPTTEPPKQVPKPPPPEVPPTQTPATPATNETADEVLTDSLPKSGGGISGSKESIIVKLNAKVKALQANLTLSMMYLEEMSEKYRTAVEEVDKKHSTKNAALNHTLTMHKELAVLQSKLIANLTEQINALTEQILNVTNSLHEQQKVSEQHFVWIFFEFAVIVWLVMCCRNKRPHTPPKPPPKQNGAFPQHDAKKPNRKRVIDTELTARARNNSPNHTNEVNKKRRKKSKTSVAPVPVVGGKSSYLPTAGILSRLTGAMIPWRSSKSTDYEEPSRCARALLDEIPRVVRSKKPLGRARSMELCTVDEEEVQYDRPRSAGFL